MTTNACHAQNPDKCRSARCPNKTGRSSSKYERLTSAERHPFTERGIAEAEAVRVDAKLKNKRNEILDLVAEFYA